MAFINAPDAFQLSNKDIRNCDVGALNPSKVTREKAQVMGAILVRKVLCRENFRDTIEDNQHSIHLVVEENFHTCKVEWQLLQ